MGFNLMTTNGDEDFRGQFLRWGGNGSGDLLAGYLLAAYAVSDHPESGRVCGWVCAALGRSGRLAPDAPLAYRDDPDSVRAVIAHAWDADGDGDAECGACVVLPETLAAARAVAEPTDPLLVFLVRVWEGCYDDRAMAELTREETERFAEILPPLVAQLTAAPWHGRFTELVELVVGAAERGETVRFG